MKLGPETIELLRASAEALAAGEDLGPGHRDELAAGLLELAQAHCEHARVFRGVCRFCLERVEVRV